MTTKDRVSNIEAKIIEIESKLNEVLKIREKFYTVHCAECGNPFILNDSQYKRRLDKSRVFYCSAGHNNVFTPQ